MLVLFAEIIPQAIFSKHGLAIGALFAYPVRILIALWFVISWPISKFLDSILGKHAGFTYGVAGKYRVEICYFETGYSHSSLFFLCIFAL